MDLWIRSQDKERLVKPVDVYIEEIIDYINKTSKFDIYCLNLANDDIKIGIYETKERALEVLDDMQRHSAYLEQMLDAGRSMELDFESDFIYEMPQK